uniref:Uncharacterized protein n=1 Tax=Candidatus Methanogaster sp. ANME-2c ERB4 TaxID=2759911 RepID=A0A7G9Y1N7_9EURY|nr:hypothetical protein KBJIOONF_00007 [Methanosarcinales archaeon ANME-2c ERB4]
MTTKLYSQPIQKGWGGSSEEPDEGNLQVRFCEGAHSNLGAITPKQEVRYGSYLTELLFFSFAASVLSVLSVVFQNIISKYQKVSWVLVTATRDTKDPKKGMHHVLNPNNLQHPAQRSGVLKRLHAKRIIRVPSVARSTIAAWAGTGSRFTRF